MKKTKLAITNPKVGKIAELAKETDHKTLVAWGLDCAERVLACFEKRHPGDIRPRKAIDAGRAWVRTGIFSMSAIRTAALDAHAAARELADDDIARSAARAAGQAVAAAHAKDHALAAAAYAATVFRDAASSADSDAAVMGEREWQYRHLAELNALSHP